MMQSEEKVTGAKERQRRKEKRKKGRERERGERNEAPTNVVSTR